MAVVDAVRGLAGEAAAAAGLVVEDVAVQTAGRRRVVRVIVDLPPTEQGGVPMDAVATVSQLLSQRLDDSDAMGGTPYVLEVSSPGVDRPLTERRHWLRARGRLVKVTLRDGSTASGRLTEVGDEGLVVDGRPVVWDTVVRGRVEVEFTRPDGAGEDEPGEDASDDEAADDEAADDDAADDDAADDDASDDDEEGGPA
jgi:ribosome maturation factor RimP